MMENKEYVISKRNELAGNLELVKDRRKQ